MKPRRRSPELSRNEVSDAGRVDSLNDPVCPGCSDRGVATTHRDTPPTTAFRIDQYLIAHLFAELCDLSVTFSLISTF